MLVSEKIIHGNVCYMNSIERRWVRAWVSAMALRGASTGTDHHATPNLQENVERLVRMYVDCTERSDSYGSAWNSNWYASQVFDPKPDVFNYCKCVCFSAPEFSITSKSFNMKVGFSDMMLGKISLKEGSITQSAEPKKIVTQNCTLNYMLCDGIELSISSKGDDTRRWNPFGTTPPPLYKRTIHNRQWQTNWPSGGTWKVTSCADLYNGPELSINAAINECIDAFTAKMKVFAASKTMRMCAAEIMAIELGQGV